MTEVLVHRAPTTSRSSMGLAGSITGTWHSFGALTMSEAVLMAILPTAEIEVPDENETAVRDYVTHLWAEDWDCPEDAVYDTW